MENRLRILSMIFLALAVMLPTTFAQDAPEAVFVEGASFGTANGITVDSNDTLFIASFFGRSIVSLNPVTGELIDQLGPDQNAGAPDDLAFGPDGSLYWTAFLPGEVVRHLPNGDTQVIIENLPGVNAITFSDDGRLFVTRAFIGDELYELDPEGVEEARLIADNLGGLNAMDIGPDGFLYGPSTFGGQVLRVNVDTGEVAAIAEGFTFPAAAKFDSLGNLYVLEAFERQVVRVDTATGEKQLVASVTDESVGILDNFTFNSADQLFIATFTGTVLEILEGGSHRIVNPEGNLAAPGGVAILAQPDGESIFVADFFVLRELDSQTGEFKNHIQAIPGITPLFPPTNVASDGENLITSSWFANTVQLWNPVTNEALETHQFNIPLNAIRFQDSLIVAELGSGSVVQLQPNGNTITLSDEIAVPTGLAASDDNLWVADWATGTISQLIEDGELLSTPKTVADGLSAPEGLAVATDGRLFVAETGAGRLSAVDTATGQISTIADGLILGAPAPQNAPPTWGFSGVAISESGTVFVTGDDARVLYRFDLS